MFSNISNRLTTKNNIRPPLLLGIIVFPFLLNSFYEKDRYVNSIKFIKGKKINNPPQKTYIIADDYSHIGFKVWNRVLKYDWAIGEGDLRQLMLNNEYKFYVLSKKTKNINEIKNIANELGLKFKNLKIMK